MDRGNIIRRLKAKARRHHQRAQAALNDWSFWDDKLIRVEQLADSIEYKAFLAHCRFIHAHDANRAARRELREAGYRRNTDGPL